MTKYKALQINTNLQSTKSEEEDVGCCPGRIKEVAHSIMVFTKTGLDTASDWMISGKPIIGRCAKVFNKEYATWFGNYLKDILLDFYYWVFKGKEATWTELLRKKYKEKKREIKRQVLLEVLKIVFKKVKKKVIKKLYKFWAENKRKIMAAAMGLCLIIAAWIATWPGNRLRYYLS